MTNVYLLQFDTDAPVSAEQRHALKDVLGRAARIALDPDPYSGRMLRWALQTAAVNHDGRAIAIDHLDPADPPVQALLVVD